MTSELVKNRRAFHDYEIEESFEAGIALVGSEVKSLKNHGGTLQDAYVAIKNEELWLIGCGIAPYSFGNQNYNHEEKRERKLLMHRSEITKLRKLTKEKGMTIIPISIYTKQGKIKVQIAVAKGKKSYDKRAALKAKEDKRSMDRALREKR
jgi:SsrA-binding protein